ncbi:hypothetical protein CASFOL_022349 [Castilleja foliolosa]|uniref:ESCRT-II complex subunit VPS36 n=1 Tax=Castilleja foliolosa TaxID=1961234 RepID=A0ABD3CYD9_9LAMI
MTAISKSMGNIVKSLESALATGNLQKVSETMDQFERQFVNMEVQAGYGLCHGRNPNLKKLGFFEFGDVTHQDRRICTCRAQRIRVGDAVEGLGLELGLLTGSEALVAIFNFFFIFFFYFYDL